MGFPMFKKPPPRTPRPLPTGLTADGVKAGMRYYECAKTPSTTYFRDEPLGWRNLLARVYRFLDERFGDEHGDYRVIHMSDVIVIGMSVDEMDWFGVEVYDDLRDMLKSYADEHAEERQKLLQRDRHVMPEVSAIELQEMIPVER